MVNIKGFVLRYNFFYPTPFFVFFIILLFPFVYSLYFPDPYTPVKSTLILLSLVFLLLTFTYKSKVFSLPQLPKVSIGIICSIFFVSLLNSYFHNIPIFTFESMRRILFWFAALFFFNFFSDNATQKFKKINITIQGIAGVFLIGAFVEYILNPTTLPHFTFGNIAHSSEYICLCLALQFGLLIHLWRENKTSLIVEALCSLSLTYIFISHSRAATLGAIFMLGAMLFLEKKYIIKIAKLLLYASLFFIVVKFLAATNMENTAGMFVNKDYSQRWLIYINTLKLILDNPLGVGLGQYEFAAIPYFKSVKEFDEFTIFNTPHNDFLHILAEDGLILTSLFALLLLSLVFTLWRDIKKTFYLHPEFLLFCLALTPLTTFQFPLLNPSPYFLISLMLGYFFALITKEFVFYEMHTTLRYGVIFIMTVALYSFVSFSAAKLISFSFPQNQALNEVACSIGNRNWLSCLNVAANAIEKKDYNKAEAYALKALHWQPLNYQAIKLLGFSYLYQGQREEACKLFKKYNAYFREPTSLASTVKEQCY